jgi:hypothetical protein
MGTHWGNGAGGGGTCTVSNEKKGLFGAASNYQETWDRRLQLVWSPSLCSLVLVPFPFVVVVVLLLLGSSRRR